METWLVPLDGLSAPKQVSQGRAWAVFSPDGRELIYPEGGSLHARTLDGTDREELREVPLRMGFNTGIPGAPMSADGSWNLQFSAIRSFAQHNRKKGKIICLTCNLKGCMGRCRFQSVEARALLKSA
jgi:hypothetical protein